MVKQVVCQLANDDEVRMAGSGPKIEQRPTRCRQARQDDYLPNYYAIDDIFVGILLKGLATNIFFWS